ncbi:MAG: hypothetical protein ACXVW5_32875 [Solirubrobacteraceae bacterium]
MFRRDRERDRRSGAPQSSGQAIQKEQPPVEILEPQMALARLAWVSGDWPAFELARSTAVRLTLGQRIEDELKRFRQVMTACTGWQDWGDDARELMLKRLSETFTSGVSRGETATEVLVRMQRIPRGAVAAALAADMKDDGEICVQVLLFENGHLADDIRAEFGEEPDQIAARLTKRDWVNFALPLLRLPPGEPRPEVVAADGQSLRRILSEAAAK